MKIALPFCVLTLAANCLLAQTVIPIPNGNFENGIKDWSASGANVFSVTPEAASLGRAGLRISPATTPGALTSQTVQVQPGKVYRLVAWGRGTDHRVTVAMKFLNKDGGALAATPDKGFRLETAAWLPGRFERYMTQAAAPQDAAGLSVTITANRNKEPVDFDDIFLVEVPEGYPVETAMAPVDVMLNDLKETPRSAKTPARIILKLDDLVRNKSGGVAREWQQFVDFTKKNQIKSNIGIICNSLEADDPAYSQWIKDQLATGLFEFWNHGYDHKEWQENGKTYTEFKGPSYDQQKEHINRSNELAREKLGITIKTFGAPFNAIDATTVRVLQEQQDMKLVLWQEKSELPADMRSLQRVVSANLESPVFNPNYERFVEGYVHNRNLNYFLMQGHAGSWGKPERFQNFVSIVRFLQNQKAEFVTMAPFLTGDVADTQLGPAK